MVLGLDISTSKIGLAVVYENGILCELVGLDINSKYYKQCDPEYRFLHKAEAFKEKVIELRDKYNEIASLKNNEEWKIRSVWVEAPLKNAKKIQTVTSLYQFNGVCCYILKDVFGFSPKRVDEHIARSKFLPEFTRKDTVRKENPEFTKIKRKLKFKTPKKYNTATRKYNFLKEKYPDEDLPKPMVTELKDVFSYPKEIEIKNYIFDKFKKKYEDSPIWNNLEWEYDRNNKLKDINFDMTDAWVVAEYGSKELTETK